MIVNCGVVASEWASGAWIFAPSEVAHGEVSLACSEEEKHVLGPTEALGVAPTDGGQE